MFHQFVLGIGSLTAWQSSGLHLKDKGLRGRTHFTHCIWVSLPSSIDKMNFADAYLAYFGYIIKSFCLTPRGTLFCKLITCLIYWKCNLKIDFLNIGRNTKIKCTTPISLKWLKDSPYILNWKQVCVKQGCSISPMLYTSGSIIPKGMYCFYFWAALYSVLSVCFLSCDNHFHFTCSL